MSQRFELIETISPDELPERYSLFSGILSSMQYAFIEGHELIARWSKLPKDSPSFFVMAETSFGSGLNFLLLCLLWKEHAPPLAKLYFISSEQTPLTRKDLAQYLSLSPELKSWAIILLENYPTLTPGFHRLDFSEGQINLLLMLGAPYNNYRELLLCGDPYIEKMLRDYYVDAWCLNGDTNAWSRSEELLITIGMLSSKTTTMTSFINNDQMKQGLVAAGFQVDSPLASDQEKGMFRAHYHEVPSKWVQRNTPWHISMSKKSNSKRAIILGAGLAGCFTADALARRGWSVTLLDANSQVGEGASGNPRAILYPKLSSYDSPLNGFMLTAYLHATRRYKKILTQFPVGQLTGILQMAYDEKERVSQSKLIDWLARYPELGLLVDVKQASLLAGIALEAGGLFIPASGWIDSQALCESISQQKGIDWMGNTSVTSLEYDRRMWHVGSYHAEVLVVSNGFQAAHFAQTEHLPLQAIRGQMTHMLSNEASDKLRIPLCAKGHILPSSEGIHHIGATYQSDSTQGDCYSHDDEENLINLNLLPTGLDWSKQIVGHWSGVRAVTPDYLPLVGPVAQVDLFQQRFLDFAKNPKHWIPFPGSYHEGLYVCTGFGSRGLTTIPLATDFLAEMITKEPFGLTRSMMQSLSPARFLRREMIRAL